PMIIGAMMFTEIIEIINKNNMPTFSFLGILFLLAYLFIISIYIFRMKALCFFQVFRSVAVERLSKKLRSIVVFNVSDVCFRNGRITPPPALLTNISFFPHLSIALSTISIAFYFH